MAVGAARALGEGNPGRSATDEVDSGDLSRIDKEDARMITEDKVQETLAAVDAMEDEKSPPHDGSGEATLLRLAALSPFEYERIREAEAKRLKIRVSALDKEIYQRRRQTEGAKDSALVEEVEPWPAPVNGNELLQQIRSHLEAHTILPTGAADALALWILGTYGYDAFRIWPGGVRNFVCEPFQLINRPG
jgi:putative DNA primase/helicase